MTVVKDILDSFLLRSGVWRLGLESSWWGMGWRDRYFEIVNIYFDALNYVEVF